MEKVKQISTVNSVIKGTGSYLPGFIVDNKTFEQIVETSDDWISSRTGIKERRIEQKKYNFEMMGEAAVEALKNAGLQAGSIDMIIASTVTPDYDYPSAACLVQSYIDAPNAVSFDLTAACAGVIFAVDVADQYIKNGRAKNILIVSGDIMSRRTDYYDRSTCILFGDGAGAIILSAEEGSSDTRTHRGVLSSYIASDCDNGKAMYIHSRTKEPGKIFDEETKKFVGNSGNIDNNIYMNGREVFQFAVKVLPKSLDEALSKINMTVNDISCIVAHQANKRILDYVIEKYNISPEKMPVNIDRYANISSSTIPVLLHELISGNKIKRGDVIAFVGFGSGLVYGANIIRM